MEIFELLLACSLDFGRRAVDVSHVSWIECNFTLEPSVKVSFLVFLEQLDLIFGVGEHVAEAADDVHVEAASRGISAYFWWCVC